MTQPPLWVCDTTFLWGVCSVEVFDVVLREAAGRVRVTPTVRAEVARRVHDRPFLRQALDAIESGAVEVVTPTKAEQRTVFQLHSSLWQNSPRSGKDLGESETIAVAGHRGWNAIVDEKKAAIVLGMRFPSSLCYTTPQVMLALVERGCFDMDRAYDLLQAMSAKPNFKHEFAGVPRARWMNAPARYGTCRF